ncbi:DUF1360 domain-containing protein [Heliobacterium undosum]|uniref:DUF1360 domain-containing protein n=1 Tax=Heliomicrobium undosum TaxID=121734 RepID=A0A845L3R5_9FIRM|nr:DUF1360 domain-containing protein [Heliomicrobium undosum]MZP29250.1 DUF1360 domain-containing protein [Heliomicrobium undosum]
MAAELLAALSIRFFLFDFILFKPIRERLKKVHYFFRKLLGCPFCQGFWCGLFIYLLNHPIESWIAFLQFGFISAILSLSWSIAAYPLLKRYEENHDIPLT